MTAPGPASESSPFPAVSPVDSPVDVLTFGETMVALRGHGPFKLGGSMDLSVAGAESNVAIGAARLDRAVTTGAFAVAQPGDREGALTRAELGLLGAGQGTVVR
ncbi:hypothetical protein [Streptomyces sp. NPDC058441]|uniref:hypothetical protein n=1 Tax=Streptomyces sp. NPDC058441 TaxID=3346502 RepID=UPI003664F861